MQDAVQPGLEDIEAKRCPRCLQPVPPKASRCPGCGQPIHTLRLLPLAIGAVGLLALVFALLVMFRMMRSEEHTSELQSLRHLVCRLLLEKKKKNKSTTTNFVFSLIPSNIMRVSRHH